MNMDKKFNLPIDKEIEEEILETEQRPNKSLEQRKEMESSVDSLQQQKEKIRNIKSEIENNDLNLEKKMELLDLFKNELIKFSENVFFNKDLAEDNFNNYISFVNNMMDYTSSSVFAKYFKEKPIKTLLLMSDLDTSGFFNKLIGRNEVDIGVDYRSVIDVKNVKSFLEKSSLSKQIATANILGRSIEFWLGSDNAAIPRNLLDVLEKIGNETKSPLLKIIVSHHYSYIDNYDKLNTKQYNIIFELEEIRYNSTSSNYLNTTAIKKKKAELGIVRDKMEKMHSDFIKLTKNITLDDLKFSKKEKIFSEEFFLYAHDMSKDYNSFGHTNGGSIGVMQKNGPNSDRVISYVELIDNPKQIEMMKVFHSPKNKGLINKELNINVEKMYLAEQVQFLDYLSGTKTENWDQLENVLKNKELDNENILRSFLSLDKGGSKMGQKILDLGEKLPAEDANAIFAKYSEIIDATKKIEDFIVKEFDLDINNDDKIITQVKDMLLQRGVDLLNNFHNEVESLDEENACRLSFDIQEELERIKVDDLATLLTFKYARRNGFKLSLEDIKNSKLQIKSPKEIKESGEKERMLEIYEKNWVDKFSQEVYEELQKDFSDAFEDNEEKEKNNKFYIYELDGELNSFVRFEKKGENKLYASALNVDPDKQGFSIGEAMMEQSLNREAENNIINATCFPSQMNSARYIEMGFVGVSSKKFQGMDVLKIVRNESLNNLIKSKNLSEKEIKEMYINKTNSEDIDIEFIEDINKIDLSGLDENTILSRYFFDKGKNGFYLVFEENVDIDNYISNFVV